MYMHAVQGGMYMVSPMVGAGPSSMVQPTVNNAMMPNAGPLV